MITFLEMLDTPEEKLKFEELYKKYRNSMYTVAWNILHNERDAEDIVHDSFRAIIENFEKINDVSCHKTWNYIVTIVKNKVNKKVIVVLLMFLLSLITLLTQFLSYDILSQQTSLTSFSGQAGTLNQLFMYLINGGLYIAIALCCGYLITCLFDKNTVNHSPLKSYDFEVGASCSIAQTG